MLNYLLPSRIDEVLAASFRLEPGSCHGSWSGTTAQTRVVYASVVPQLSLSNSAYEQKFPLVFCAACYSATGADERLGDIGYHSRSRKQLTAVVAVILQDAPYVQSIAGVLVQIIKIRDVTLTWRMEVTHLM